MKFVYVLRQSRRDWKSTMHCIEVQSDNFPYTKHTSPCMKIVRTTLQCILVLQSRGEVHKKQKNQWDKPVTQFSQFSKPCPRNWKTTIHCNIVLTNFPYMVTYIQFKENYWTRILMCSCLPIAGRMSQNVYKFCGTILFITCICICLPIQMPKRRVKTNPQIIHFW